MLLLGTRGRVTDGNKGKGFRAGKREELIEVWETVNGGRALFSFKFTTVYLIEWTKHIMSCGDIIIYQESQIVMVVSGV